MQSLIAAKMLLQSQLNDGNMLDEDTAWRIFDKPVPMTLLCTNKHEMHEQRAKHGASALFSPPTGFRVNSAGLRASSAWTAATMSKLARPGTGTIWRQLCSNLTSSCTHSSRLCEATERLRLFSDHNGSLLRWQPRASDMTQTCMHQRMLAWTHLLDAQWTKSG